MKKRSEIEDKCKELEQQVRVIRQMKQKRPEAYLRGYLAALRWCKYD